MTTPILRSLFQATTIAVTALASSAVMATNAPPPEPQVTSCKHWDKVVFMITDQRVARLYSQPVSTELDVKFSDDIAHIADLKERVLYFLKDKAGETYTRTTDDYNIKKAIKIIDVEYAIECDPVTLTKTATVTTIIPTTVTATTRPVTTTTTATVTTTTTVITSATITTTDSSATKVPEI